MPDDVMIDCSTGEVECTPLTPEEIAARQAAADALAQQQAAATAERQRLIAVVAADPTPSVQALGKLIGVIQ